MTVGRPRNYNVGVLGHVDSGKTTLDQVFLNLLIRQNIKDTVGFEPK